MAVHGLNHFTIRSADLDRSIDFYERVLGLRVGERPEFDFPGAWRWTDVDPVVHLIGEADPDRTGGSDEDGGSMHHVAFTCTDLDAMRARLTALGVPFRDTRVPTNRQIQLLVTDPDGLQLELIFAR